MIVRKLILLIVFIAIAVSSCQKVLNEKIEDKEPKLVLNALLTPDSLISVSVTLSVSILSNDTAIYIPDALVKIFENESFIGELTYDENLRLYKSYDKKPSPGSKYRIEVSANGFNTVSAEVLVPLPVEIASVDTFRRKNESDFYGSREVLVFKTSINDPGNDENYYLMYIERFDSSLIIDNKLYKSTEYLMTKSIIIELVGFELFTNYRKAQNDDGMDLSNERYIDGNYYALSDKTFNGKSVSFELELVNSLTGMGGTPVNYRMKLLSVSKDFFLYLYSVALHSGSDDPFSEAVSIYSNVKGGYGIALGCSGSSKIITLNSK